MVKPIGDRHALEPSAQDRLSISSHSEMPDLLSEGFRDIVFPVTPYGNDDGFGQRREGGGVDAPSIP